MFASLPWIRMFWWPNWTPEQDRIIIYKGLIVKGVSSVHLSTSKVLDRYWKSPFVMILTLGEAAFSIWMKSLIFKHLSMTTFTFKSTSSQNWPKLSYIFPHLMCWQDFSIFLQKMTLWMFDHFPTKWKADLLRRRTLTIQSPDTGATNCICWVCVSFSVTEPFQATCCLNGAETWLGIMGNSPTIAAKMANVENVYCI